MVENWREDIVGQSRVMQKLLDDVSKAAREEKDVLFLGEVATGKTLLATAFHKASLRSDKPFVRVDLNYVPSHLFEVTLFGDTNALNKGDTDGVGKAEEANGGILLLDEIGDMPYEMQENVLKFLEEKTISRVGSSERITLDLIVLLTTTRNLKELLQRKWFHPDFYNRIHNKVIHVPRLKEHLEDLPDLVRHFIKKFNVKLEKNVNFVTPELLEVLLKYFWHGNVRELILCIQEGVANARGENIELNDIPHLAKFWTE